MGSNHSNKFKKIDNGFILQVEQDSIKREIRFDLQTEKDSKIRWDERLKISCIFQEELPSNYHSILFINISVPIIDISGKYATVLADVLEHGRTLKLLELKSGLWTDAFINFPSWVY